MSEIKNIFFAAILSLVILMGWQFFFSDNKQEQAKPHSENTQIIEQNTISPDNSNTANNLANPTNNTPLINQDHTDYSQFDIKIDNPKISGTFSPKGLSFKNIYLKNYQNSCHKDNKTAEDDNLCLFNQNGPQSFYADFGYLNLATNNFDFTNNTSHTTTPTLDLPGPNTLWKTTNTELSPNKPILLSWTNAQGIEFNTKISIDQDYLFSIERSIKNPNNSAISLGMYSRIFKTIDNLKSSNAGTHEGAIGFWNNQMIKYEYKKLFKNGLLNYNGQSQAENKQHLSWMGFADKYWMASLVSNETQTNLSLRSKAADGVNFYNKAQVESIFSTQINPNAEINHQEYLFIGAKELNVLDNYEKNQHIKMFDHAVDFGALYFITKPIFVLLQYFNQLLGNFGLAIMLLTVVIKALLFPLARKSIISMHKMRDIQPELDKIKARYKDDKQKLNLEILNLFRKNKVSPFSSLVPLFLQLPIFFALYKVLNITIEMRHAPFFGWIKDLSARDSINLFDLIDFAHIGIGTYINIGILPILLGLTMYLQQKFQPPVSDPNQAMMMRWLPWIFVIISASFPAGLVVYWGWNNLLSIAQQVLIEKFFIPQKTKK